MDFCRKHFTKYAFINLWMSNLNPLQLFAKKIQDICERAERLMGRLSFCENCHQSLNFSDYKKDDRASSALSAKLGHSNGNCATTTETETD